LTKCRLATSAHTETLSGTCEAVGKREKRREGGAWVLELKTPQKINTESGGGEAARTGGQTHRKGGDGSGEGISVLLGGGSERRGGEGGTTSPNN